MGPEGALAGLEAVFGLHRHELAGGDELLELGGDLLFQPWPVGLQIADKQVHQGFGVGPHAIVGPGGARQLADQKDKGAQAGPQLAVGGAVALPADDLVILALQLAGVEEIGGDLVVDEVRRYHGAQVRGRGLLRRLEDDLQLGAQLSLGAGVVGVAQHPFPEPPPGGEQGVIGDEEGVVVMGGGEAGVLQMAGEFALIGVQAGRDGGRLLRLFAQDGLADDAFDIGVGELHLDPEPGLEALQAGHGVQGGLAGAHEQQSAAEIGAAVLGDFLNVVGSVDLLADELLDLVHHEQGAGEMPLLAENLPHDVQGIVHRGGVVVLELIPDRGLSIGGGGILGLGTDQRLGEGHGEL